MSADRRQYWKDYYIRNRDRITTHRNRRYREMKSKGIQIIQQRQPQYNLIRKVARSLGVTNHEARDKLGIPQCRPTETNLSTKRSSESLTI